VTAGVKTVADLRDIGKAVACRKADICRGRVELTGAGAWHSGIAGKAGLLE
jgi:hypothetical protein